MGLRDGGVKKKKKGNWKMGMTETTGIHFYAQTLLNWMYATTNRTD